MSNFRYFLSHPIKTSSDITSHYTDSRKLKFQEELTSLYQKSKIAYEEKDCVEKSKKWQKVFGSRFRTKSYKDCADEDTNRSLSAIMAISSRPWLKK